MTAVPAVTASRRSVDIFRPDPAAIDFGDIAHHLAKICRYAGATPEHYSVAQHSCLVAEACERIAPRTEAAVYGLLHDAHETYMGDVSWVLESNLSPGACREIAFFRDTLDAAIHLRAGLAWPLPAAFKDVLATAHARVLAAEVACDIALVEPPKGVLPSARSITAWAWPKAEEKFIHALNARALLAGLSIDVRAA